MQIIELRNDELILELKVTIAKEVIFNEVKAELNSLAKKTKVDGFRFGKAPLNIVHRRYGDSIRKEKLNARINYSIDEIIKDRNLQTFDIPELSNFEDSNQEISFILKFELLPKITFPNLDDISLERPVLVIAQEDINKEVQNLLSFYSQYHENSEYPAKKGDQIIFDATCYLYNKELKHAELKDYHLILGHNSFIKEFEEKLIGSNVNDKIDINVTIPEGFLFKDLVKKVVKFKVLIKAINKPLMPELNDEFSQKFNCKNVEDFFEFIKENIKNSFSDSIYVFIKMHLFDKLEDLLNFKVPESVLIKEEKVLENRFIENKVDLSKIKDKEGNFVNKHEYVRKIALRRIRIGLFLIEYSKSCSLEVKKEEVKSALLAQANQYNNKKNIVEFYQKNPHALDYLKKSILEDKTVKYILDSQIKFLDKEYNMNDLTELLRKSVII